MQSFYVQVGADKVTNLLMWRPSDHGPYCEGGLTILHKVEDDAVNWLNSVATTALAK